MDITKQQLSNLVRDPSLEKLELGLKQPNFFSILKVGNTEIRHSNFLAWLLDPNESHNLRTIFLKWFLKEIFSDDKVQWASEFEVESFNLNSVKILREWENIDILIENNDFVVIIENKIYAKESSKQLQKYKDIEFKQEKKAFVFLTIDGVEPIHDQDQKSYISIDYNKIYSMLENIISIYKDSLSQRILYYLQDYQLILSRDIMETDKTNDLAKMLYENHKEAIDFIIKNKPDRVNEIREYIESAISEKGYILQTCNKSYARFLTKECTSFVPKSGGLDGWKNSESFLFEIIYNENNLGFRCAISPGNEKNREILSEIAKTIKGWKKQSGNKWWTFYSSSKKVDFNKEEYINNPPNIKNEVFEMLNNQKDIIKLISDKIIERKEDFIY